MPQGTAWNLNPTASWVLQVAFFRHRQASIGAYVVVFACSRTQKVSKTATLAFVCALEDTAVATGGFWFQRVLETQTIASCLF